MAVITRLVSGGKKSCGCLRREASAAASHDRTYQVTHGLNSHLLYDTWYGMMVRCHNPRNKAYRNYGARGIKVHEPWHDIGRFIADIEASIGPRPEGKYPSGKPLYSLDRIDNNGNYEPGNVRWATASQQVTNTRQKPPVQCSEDDCVRPARSNGFCTMHYMRWRRRSQNQAA